jgi:hypothetical protein
VPTCLPVTVLTPLASKSFAADSIALPVTTPMSMP